MTKSTSPASVGVRFNAQRAEYAVHLTIAMRDVADALRLRDTGARVWALGHLRRARQIRSWGDAAMFPVADAAQARMRRTR